MGPTLIFLPVGLQVLAVVLAFAVVRAVRPRWGWLLILVAMSLQAAHSLMVSLRNFQAGGSLPVSEWISLLILLLFLVGLRALVLEGSRVLPQASPPHAADLTQLMESVVDTADVWINTLDLQSQVVLWNRAAERISGYQRDEVLGGTKIWEWLYPDEAYRTEITQQAAAILQRDEAVRNFETTIRTKTGETRVISWSSKSLKDEQGRIAGSLAIGQDVTERKNTERALRESERKLSQLIGNLPGFVYRSVKVGNWTLGYLSEGFRKITGCGPEEFIGDPNRSYLELVPLSHREAIRAKWQRILEDQSVFEEEYPITTASGETRWVWERGHGTYDEEGRLLFVEGFVTEITERKKTEEALRASEALFRSYIESSPIGVFICDEQGRYLQVNRAAAVITGYSREELLTLSIPDLMPPESSKQGAEHFQHLVETGHSIGELGFKHKDGHTG